MTIKERALTYARAYYGIGTSAAISKKSYEAGAASQRKIDIAKACEWLKTNYGQFDGKVEDFVADFKKAMENE